MLLAPGRLLAPSAARWSPRRLPGLVGWWRADQGITLVGSKVSQWDDISGAGNHATQGTDSLRLTYNATGFQGRPGLEAGAVTQMTVASSVVTSEWTFYAAYQTDATETGTFQYLLGNEDADAGVHWRNSEAKSVEPVIRDGATVVNVPTPNFTPGAAIVGSIWTDAAGAAGSWNSESGGATGSATCGSAPGNLVLMGRTGAAGGDQFLGTVAEIFCCNVSISTADHAKARAYLGRRYGIVV